LTLQALLPARKQHVPALRTLLLEQAAPGSPAASVAVVAVLPAAAATGGLDTAADVSAASSLPAITVAIEYTLDARAETGSGSASEATSIFLLLLSLCCSLLFAMRYAITISRRFLRAVLAVI
jgi:hypothetical protein